jgi:hypothetical protein
VAAVTGLRNALRLLPGWGRATNGGTIPPPRPLSADELPAILSPGRSTTIRPGETILEATERLMEGEDL